MITYKANKIIKMQEITFKMHDVLHSRNTNTKYTGNTDKKRNNYFTKMESPTQNDTHSH